MPLVNPCQECGVSEATVIVSDLAGRGKAICHTCNLSFAMLHDLAVRKARFEAQYIKKRLLSLRREKVGKSKPDTPIPNPTVKPDRCQGVKA